MFWHRSGQPIPVECTVHPLRIGGRQEGSVVAFRDISRRKDIEERLRWQATHDPLTELCNRRHLEEAIERELSRLRRSRERSALVYIDLDRFKHINDTAGHAAGDELLIAVSRELRARLRSSDLLARLGGDEFAVLLRNVAEDDIEAAAERFRGALADCAFSFDGRRYEISGSVGVTLLDGRSGSPGDALANGDIACHIAKREGRNRIHIYAADRDERVAMDYELGWSSRLRQALEHDRFVLHFQPIVSVDALAGVEAPRDGRTLWEALDAGRRAEDERYEVLVRLAGARNEVIRPDAFIPTAERLDLMPDIDAWVVRRAMERLAAVERESGRCTFTINLSGHSLCSPGLAVQVAETVEALGIDPRRIVFEIAETAAIANLDAASRFIEDIRAVGCGFALDDFGSGFSSFAHLKHLPVEYVKIEGAFVQGMARDPVDRAMVASMNDIAHALGCR
ncbi:MAG: EAL domain-containing protein, partial [Gammaproteobacteria bacterium]|nr:EAL domain-containing protein [Gammaproteobacteria bacterium]